MTFSLKYNSHAIQFTHSEHNSLVSSITPWVRSPPSQQALGHFHHHPPKPGTEPFSSHLPFHTPLPWPREPVVCFLSLATICNCTVSWFLSFFFSCLSLTVHSMWVGTVFVLSTTPSTQFTFVKNSREESSPFTTPCNHLLPLPYVFSLD